MLHRSPCTPIVTNSSPTNSPRVLEDPQALPDFYPTHEGHCLCKQSSFRVSHHTGLTGLDPLVVNGKTRCYPTGLDSKCSQ